MEPTLFSSRDSYDSMVMRWMVGEKECQINDRIVESYELTMSQLPMLQDRDLNIVSHEPMVQYLLERYPGEPLLPGDPKIRAQIRQICWLIRDGDKEFVGDLNLILSRVRYVAGSEFTLADIYAGVRLHMMMREGEKLPERVRKYYNRLAGRRAFIKAIR